MLRLYVILSIIGLVCLIGYQGYRNVFYLPSQEKQVDDTIAEYLQSLRERGKAYLIEKSNKKEYDI